MNQISDWRRLLPVLVFFCLQWNEVLLTITKISFTLPLFSMALCAFTLTLFSMALCVVYLIALLYRSEWAIFIWVMLNKYFRGLALFLIFSPGVYIFTVYLFYFCYIPKLRLLLGSREWNFNFSCIFSCSNLCPCFL